MRVLKAALTATVSAAVISLVAGCSGTGSSVQSITPGPQVHSSIHFDGTGVAPKYLALLKFGQSLHVVPNNTNPPQKLAVSDFGTGAVEILNSRYALSQTVTTGLSGPDGDWIDQAGNLYVANYAGPYVQEYAPGGSSPSFTYSSGLGDPVGVTTDESGHVYVVDYGFGSSGLVAEYAQGSNTPIASCPLTGGGVGIAVGETGKVFVSFNNSNTGSGNILEFPHGLAGCSARTLAPTLLFAGGMQIANNRALVVCDQLGPTIDIINPPYTSISATISSGYGDPFHVALNKSNGLMFVADVASGNVQVQDYPSGVLVTTLGSANGLLDPAGVATFPYQH